MRFIGPVVGAILAAGVPTACGSAGGSTADSGADEPEQVTLNVVATDNVPLDVLFNVNGRICRVDSIEDAFAGIETPALQVVVKDQGGATVAAGDMPRQGGEHAPDTCSMSQDFEVDPSEFYEVTVTGGSSSQYVETTTVQWDESEYQIVEMTF